MDEAALVELERLVAAATPPPWTCEPGPYFEVMDGENRPVRASWFGGNARFIAAARTALPALVAEVRRLRGMMEEMIGAPQVGDMYVSEPTA